MRGTSGLVDASPNSNKHRSTTKTTADCLPQGLAPPPYSNVEEFSFAAMADSTFEYLPKQFALLGGHASQYQSMYEKSIEAANKYLLFRPMTPTNEKILVLGKGNAAGDPDIKGSRWFKSRLGRRQRLT